MNKRDHMGMRGESIAIVRLTEPCRADGMPYFLVHFLGDKSPLFDALVELVGAGDKTPYFFAQVKSTREGYDGKNRLKVQVAKEDVQTIALYPAPTYVIGIDDKSERAYVVAVQVGMKKKISSLNTAHQLSCATLKLLWEEVVEYWKDKKMEQKRSRFTN